MERSEIDQQALEFIKEFEPTIRELDDFLAPLKFPEHSTIQTFRMNVIMRLRNHQYLDIPLSKGSYSFKGVKEKQMPFLPAKEWPQEQQEVLEWLHKKLPPPTYQKIRAQFRNHPVFPHHQRAPGYTLTYELADRARGFLWNGFIIKQKWIHQPRFSIICPSFSRKEEVLELARKLGTISRVEVRLIGTPEGDPWKEVGFKKLNFQRQGLYNLINISQSKFIKQWRNRTRSYIRKNLRELTMVPLTDLPGRKWKADATKVIERWVEGPAGQKQRQLGIKRDYKAIQLGWESIRETSYLFYRDGVPVGVIVYDPSTPTTVSDLICKGLNYGSQPGGYHNTGLTMMIMASKNLVDQGFTHLNDGGIWGLEPGLYDFKSAMIEKSGGTEIKSIQWYLPGAKYTPERKSSK